MLIFIIKSLNLIKCEKKLHFTDTIIQFKSERLFNIHQGWDLRRHLLTKIEYLNFIADVDTNFLIYLKLLSLL